MSGTGSFRSSPPLGGGLLEGGHQRMANGASGLTLVSSRPRSAYCPGAGVVRSAVQDGSLVSPPQTSGKTTDSPGASVRLSLLVPEKQSLLPHTRLPAASSKTISCRPSSSTRTHGTAETLVTTSSKVGLPPTGALPGPRTSKIGRAHV